MWRLKLHSFPVLSFNKWEGVRDNKGQKPSLTDRAQTAHTELDDVGTHRERDRDRRQIAVKIGKTKTWQQRESGATDADGGRRIAEARALWQFSR